MKPQTWVIIAGSALIASGCAHGFIWLLTGQTWEGPLSIRKPLLFGASTGLTLVSLGWIQSKLKPATYDVIASPLFAAAMLIEVGLITMQYWRGEASHFNHDSMLGSSIDRGITFLIIFASIYIVDIARRSFNFLNATREMKLAIRAGLMFLLISCGLGFFILFYGEHLASLGRAPETFGKSGVLKFPHGVTIHAIQFLPLLVWAMMKLNIPRSKRVRLLQYSIASMASLLLFSIFQTFSGLARFDLGLGGGIWLAVTILFAMIVIKELASASFFQPRSFPKRPSAATKT